MNLGELKTTLKDILREPTTEASFTTWLNESVKELAYEFELPGLKLKTPATLATTESDWQYLLSAVTPPTAGYTYMKKVWKVSSDAHPQGFAIGQDLQVLDRIDPDHDETGDDVDRIAIEDDADDATLGIYPMAVDSLNLWYFRNPIAMEDDADVPDGIPAAYHYGLLIPAAVLKAFRSYPHLDSSDYEGGDNTRMLRHWQAEYRVGLYGDGTRIGLIDALKKFKKPRIRGAPPGASLAGADTYTTWW